MTGPSGDQPSYPEQPKYDQPGSYPSYPSQPPYSSQPSYGDQPSYSDQPSYGQQPYPQAPPPPYSQEGYPAPAGPKPLSVLAVLALVTGLFCGLTGVILGFFGLRDTKDGAKRGRGLAIAGIVLGVLTSIAGVLLAMLVVGAASDAIDDLATNIDVGDCIEEIPSGATVESLPTVDCSEPHIGEALAEVTVPDSDTYPGEDVILGYQEQCTTEIDTTTLPANWTLYTLYPTEETWAVGDRSVVCIVITEEPTTGSLG